MLAYISMALICKNRLQHIVFSGQVSYLNTTSRILMIIWPKRRLAGPHGAHDVVNPRMVELEVAKEILSELFDIRTHEVDEMIRQRMEERQAYDQAFNLCAA